MDTQSVADRLVELCRDARYKQAQDELYSADAVSVEPDGSMWQSCEGLEALNAKIIQWEQMVEEVHETGVSDPIVAGDFFSCRMTFDLTVKGAGRIQANQIAVYQLKGGKIVLEHFFYTV